MERGTGSRALILRVALALVAFVTTGTVHAQMDTTARIEQGESFVPRPARGVEHSCVALDGEIVHDPHPSRAGLLELRYFEVLVAVIAAPTQIP